MYPGFIRQGLRSCEQGRMATYVLPFILIALLVTTSSPLAAQEAPVEPTASSGPARRVPLSRDVT